MGLCVQLCWSEIPLGFLISCTHNHMFTHTNSNLDYWLLEYLNYSYLLKSQSAELISQATLLSSSSDAECAAEGICQKLFAFVFTKCLLSNDCFCLSARFPLWHHGVRNSLLAIIRQTVWARPGISTSGFWWGCIMTAGNHLQLGIISSNSISHIVTWLSK